MDQARGKCSTKKEGRVETRKEIEFPPERGALEALRTIFEGEDSRTRVCSLITSNMKTLWTELRWEHSSSQQATTEQATQTTIMDQETATQGEATPITTTQQWMPDFDRIIINNTQKDKNPILIAFTTIPIEVFGSLLYCNQIYRTHHL